MTGEDLLATFDLFNLIFITVLLVITWPLALFVYSKLLFVPPYSANFTFKLIVVNGMTELLYCTTFLINYQIATFPFARPLMILLQDRRFGYPMKTIDILMGGLGQHTAFFVALNRLTAMIYMRRKGSDANFFYASMIISLFLTSWKVINLFVSDQYYMETDFGAGPVFIPRIEVYSDIVRTILDVENFVVSCSTLILNVTLAVFLARRQLSVDHNENRRFRAERGLIITSFVSYLFYSLFFLNSFIARYFDVTFCGYAQFLFLGLASMTPFWCLIIFASSIRRFAFKCGEKSTITSVNSNNNNNNNIERHQMLLSFPAIVSPILLLIAVRKCTLHPNCKALIILWMVAQIIMNVSIIIFSLVFMFIEHEGAPEFIHLPVHRRMYVENSLRFYYVSCFFEFGISFERALSLRKPQKYHLSGISWQFVAFWSLLSLVYGSLIGHWITEGAGTLQCAIGTVVSNVVDVAAFYMNICVYIHCRRLNRITSDTTLNGRYQVKEVYAITRAMLPVYCIGSIVKIPVATITWLFLFDIVSYACSEIVCTVACVSSCGITSALFMRFHSVIRGRVARIFTREADHHKSIVVAPATVEETTSAYFRIINGMWE